MREDICTGWIKEQLVYGKKDDMLIFKINREVKKMLKYVAEKHGLTISDIIRICLDSSTMFEKYVREYCREIE